MSEPRDDTVFRPRVAVGQDGVFLAVWLTRRQVTGWRGLMSTVHVRIGDHRTKYHTDASCPLLNGKRDTYLGEESMSEDEAEEQGLTACQHCER